MAIRLPYDPRDQQPPVKKRKHKYNARKTVIDDITFDSAAEARRYGQLKMRQLAGEIKELTLQPEFPLIVNGKKLGTRGRKYVGDFSYIDTHTGLRVVEDVKGMDTDISKLKRDLVHALYEIEVLLIK